MPTGFQPVSDNATGDARDGGGSGDGYGSRDTGLPCGVRDSTRDAHNIRDACNIRRARNIPDRGTRNSRDAGNAGGGGTNRK